MISPDPLVRTSHALHNRHYYCLSQLWWYIMIMVMDVIAHIGDIIHFFTTSIINVNTEVICDVLFLSLSLSRFQSSILVSLVPI